LTACPVERYCGSSNDFHPIQYHHVIIQFLNFSAVINHPQRLLKLPQYKKNDVGWFCSQAEQSGVLGCIPGLQQSGILIDKICQKVAASYLVSKAVLVS